VMVVRAHTSVSWQSNIITVRYEMFFFQAVSLRRWR
jgi:hypothetical protein